MLERGGCSIVVGLIVFVPLFTALVITPVLMRIAKPLHTELLSAMYVVVSMRVRSRVRSSSAAVLNVGRFFSPRVSSHPVLHSLGTTLRWMRK